MWKHSGRNIYIFIYYCCCAVAKLCPTLCNLMDCSMPGFRVLHSFPESIESVMLSNHLIFCCCLLLLLPSIFPNIRVFYNESSVGQSIGVLASASVLPMNTQGWFHLGLTLTFLQSKGLSRVFSSTTNLKASILQHSAVFKVQFSHPNITTGKITALTMCTLVSKVMSLLFNISSESVIAFLPRSKLSN